jgi:hypothetical protein
MERRNAVETKPACLRCGFTHSVNVPHERHERGCSCLSKGVQPIGRKTRWYVWAASTADEMRER